jgi:hypothetical protein
MAVETSNHPVAMATALHPGAAVGAAVVASEVREAEMIAAAQHHHHHPGMVVVQEPVYYVSVVSECGWASCLMCVIMKQSSAFIIHF